MDLIRGYNDQESQSSSTSDDNDTSFSYKNAAPSTSASCSNDNLLPNRVSNFEPLERIPLDRLMIATAAIAAQKPLKPKRRQKQKQAAFNVTSWLDDVEKELHAYIGSIQVLQKHTILESMDRFISKFQRNYEKIIKPSTADIMSTSIRSYLHIYKFLLQSMDKGKRYYKRFIKLLAIYTDMELCASLRGTEYDKSIAERMVLNYQTYLDHSDNSMVLNVLLNTRRLWREHRGILVLLFQYFLTRTTSIELPDTLFMKNLIMFKKWLLIEEVPEERQNARRAFVQFVKPKKTICMNSLFKPYLPVDEEGFVTIADSNDILDKEYSLASLIRCVKKAEIKIEVQQNEEVIVLTDDEDRDDDTLSNRRASSSSYNDESNDFDWDTASSQQDDQNSRDQNIIETVSIDSPAPHKRTSSLSSLDSRDLNMDTTNALATDRNGEDVLKTEDGENQQRADEMPSTSSAVAISEQQIDDVNGDNTGNLSTLDESMFNRLVNDINSTHLSFPGNGNLSDDARIVENGEPSQIDDSSVVNCEAVSKPDEAVVESEKTEKADKVPLENDQLNGVLAHTSDVLNGQASTTQAHTEHNLEVANEIPSNVLNNHVGRKSPDESPVKTCDKNLTIISSQSSFRKKYNETLNNADEMVEDDLRHHKQPSIECSTSKNVETSVELSAKPIPDKNTIARDKRHAIEMEGGLAEEATDSETVQDPIAQDWVPMAESTASITADTSLLTKSEQDILFKDRDASLIFSDLWSNGTTDQEPTKSDENKSPRISSNSPSPITFLQNGTDPNFRLKTYARRHRKGYVETKTISTQTSRFSLSGCPSPVTTMDESDSSKNDKHLISEKEEDELFLRDIFITPDIPPRSGGSPRIRSPTYLSSTPMASARMTSTPIASTSDIVPNVNESTEPTTDSSIPGSSEIVVKRKRGRPRKYPLPEPGTTPIVPKPPRAPRAPRQPRKPKSPKPHTGPVEVFERMKLRERKPKPAVPEPVQQSKSLSEIVKPKSKGRKRRNTIKMTIDAIFNARTTKLRAVQARRISNMLGISLTSPQLATILKRINYDKSINASNNINSDSRMNDSSMLQTFSNRSNGQMNSSEPISQHTSSTILARKTYIKPNITFSSFTSAIRRFSFSSRRISFNSSARPVNRSKMPRKSAKQSSSKTQRYAAIDIFDVSSRKRGRKNGTKDSTPRKKPAPKNQLQNSSTVEIANSIIQINDITNPTVELVDLTKEMAPFELDTSNEMNIRFANIHTALSSTQQNHNDSEMMAQKRRNLLSDDTETDFTNEFTTDPESTVEDTDDSHTRKSKRSRKRPKILDL